MASLETGFGNTCVLPCRRGSGHGPGRRRQLLEMVSQECQTVADVLNDCKMASMCWDVMCLRATESLVVTCFHSRFLSGRRFVFLFLTHTAQTKQSFVRFPVQLSFSVKLQTRFKIRDVVRHVNEAKHGNSTVMRLHKHCTLCFCLCAVKQRHQACWQCP